MLHKAMFHCYHPNGKLFVEHAEVEINYFKETHQRLEQVWRKMHPSIAYFQVAAFIRQPNGIFRMEKDHHV